MIDLANQILSARQRNRKELKKADRLKKEGNDAGAERIWRRFLVESPDDPVILFNLGVLLKTKGDKDREKRADLYFEAHKLFAEVVCSPFVDTNLKADTMNNIGIIMEKSGHTEKALKAYTFALEINPDHAAALVNYGDSLRCLGDISGADETYRKVIATHPDSAEANYNAGYIKLLMGDYAAGWKGYLHRHRMKAANTKPIVSTRPQWKGEPLEGKTLMLTEEQGYGDGFMGIRFAQCFAAMGARVVWGAQEAMREVMRGATGVSACVSRDDATEFDYHLPLLDAPHWLGITAENIPQPPYLSLCDDWPKWQAPKDPGKPKVGLIWRGSPLHGRDRARSIAPELLQPLIDDHPKLEFYSLQFGPNADEVTRLRGINQDLLTTVRSWTETAQIAHWLDLLIAVDTGPVHLFGALNRPAFMLCPNSPDWRWQLGREDSDWYPRLRIFRQPNGNDWQTPVAKINEALKDFCCSPNTSALVSGA